MAQGFGRVLGAETGRPTLSLDIGSLMGSLVGQSEANIRQALRIADAMAPCVLFIDEIEKGLAGSTGGAGDGGVAARLFGTLLTWLNDHDSDVFVVATSNDLSRLPPEFSRAERWDGCFFLDLPGAAEKAGIWSMYRRRFELPDQPMPEDGNWTGAEIRACCRLAALLGVPLAEAATHVVPVDGDASTRKWVLLGADSDYLVGSFDGATFVPETKKLTGSLGRAFYAAQTFSHAPDGRVIQIGWMRAGSPGMPFNQAMSIPLELKLTATPAGPRLTWSPARELAALRSKSHTIEAVELADGVDALKGVQAELAEVRLVVTPAAGSTVRLIVRGVPIVYNAAKGELTAGNVKAVVPLRDGKLRLTVFADRTSYEIFAGDGTAYLPIPVIPKAGDRTLSLTAVGGAKADALEVHELKSIWAK